MAKMRKNEIYAKIMKRKKIKVFIILSESHQQSWILLKKLRNTKKITRQISQGQYAYR